MKIIFKHSYRCPVSLKAKKEIEHFLPFKPESVEFELIDVIQQRTLSQEIAATYGVRHASPQVLIINDNNICVFSTSHYDITESNLKKEIGNILNGE